ncbi:hypothetical protein JCM14244_16540 [Venenivibrio stagnispumantis]|uniref:P pilus assembly protein, chaperone PapD n=1 Tax=Venenivibrio stagnispumantis TaxID=407998 RepID=A0AA45WPD7_9AQUI|nr:fimbria/pilus periplasmic chaperone [Venenivibrio stagnispumantis]MCW4573992.1 fimbria/pilus periplasmic chaperone [Venenivibrio stagnispumantis]SMP21105.1 P pilus assembly protein, chaperone PapD [Venenivibrio stagnispumantis]
MIKELLGFLAMSSIMTQAYALSIYPIPVMLEKNKAYLNIEDEGARYQATIYRWTQENGEDKLIPVKDDEMVVFPNIFKANGKKSIKIIYLAKDNDDKKEKAYRLILDELDVKKIEDKDKNTLKLQKSLSIPVFIPAKNEILRADITCKDNTITIENKGNTHLKIIGIGDKQITDYVLPDSKKSYQVESKKGMITFEKFKQEYECN